MTSKDRISVIFDDILNQPVDAIVNPANSHMLHGGGLAGVIAHTGGHDVITESAMVAPVPTGQAIVTGAGNLPFKAVIHVVGPVWAGEDDSAYWEEEGENADRLLMEAHINAVRLAAKRDLKTVAFPAVSCGIFKFPVGRAAPIAIGAVSAALKNHPEVEQVVFCLLDDHHYDAFSEAWESLEEG